MSQEEIERILRSADASRIDRHDESIVKGINAVSRYEMWCRFCCVGDKFFRVLRTVDNYRIRFNFCDYVI